MHLGEHAAAAHELDRMLNHNVVDFVDQPSLRRLCHERYLGAPDRPIVADQLLVAGGAVDHFSPSQRRAARRYVQAQLGQALRPDEQELLWLRGPQVRAHASLTGHTTSVNSVAAVTLTDGRVLLASASWDRTVRLGDPATGSPVGEPLTDHTTSVRSVAAVTLTDGRVLLASAGWDRTVRLWDPATGSPVGEPLTGHTNTVYSVAAVTLTDGRVLLASAGWDHTVRLWDPATGSPVGEPLTGHTNSVNSVAAVTLTDGRVLLASASSDGTVGWHPQLPFTAQASSSVSSTFTGITIEAPRLGHHRGRVAVGSTVRLRPESKVKRECRIR
jgi:hypothetical protein